MKHTVSLTLLALALTAAVATPAAAVDKEHRQLAADIRMLQEQSQQLQNLLAALGEALKAVNVAINARLDQQTEASRKSAADQKLVIDNLSNDVRVIREKLDDNNVRIGSLSQEVEALRQSVQQLGAARSTTELSPVGGPPDQTTAAGGAPAVPVGTSPQKMWDAAHADYTQGQWNLAILGYEAFIRSFPRSDLADNAQVNIGNSYLADGKNDKAVEAYDKAIRTYSGGDAIPEAYYKKGLALQQLKDADRAREAWEFALKNFPDSTAGQMSKQRLDQLR